MVSHIVLPNDETRKKQLRNKLKEYKERMDPCQNPELQMDTICKVAILESLLEDGQINTWNLFREMGNTYGLGLSPIAFDNACSVIENYCKAGGVNLRDGTGLR